MAGEEKTIRSYQEYLETYAPQQAEEERRAKMTPGEFGQYMAERGIRAFLEKMKANKAASSSE